MTLADLIKLVQDAEVNKTVQLPPNFQYTNVEFDSADWNFDGNLAYSWKTHSASKDWSSIRPSGPGDTIKTWKTLKGAKKNFIAHVQWACSLEVQNGG